MNDYMKGNLRAARYFGMAMMMIVAFSFMANQVPGTAAASVAVGLSVAPDSTLLENVDTMSSDMPVATEGEDYGKAFYDLDGYPTRGYLSSDEVKGLHLKSDKMKDRFKKRLAKVYNDFVDTMGQKALDISVHFSKNKGIDIPPSVILAQAISESRYGTSRLAVQGNNYFGIQYRKKKRGITGPIKALDADHNKELKSYKFAHYKTPWWSLYHHASLLKHMYAKRLIKVDIPLREQWHAAICGCDDSRMLAEDAKAERTGKGFYYAAACEYVARDGKTSKYVATLQYLTRLHKLDKLDQEWEKLKRQ
jgi:flagellum-specific peptidoglycan hydrolase FlgJ